MGTIRFSSWQFLRVQTLIAYGLILGEIVTAKTPEEKAYAEAKLASMFGIKLHEPSFGRVLTLSEREEFSRRIIRKCIELCLSQARILRLHPDAKEKFTDFVDSKTLREVSFFEAGLDARTEALLNSAALRQSMVANEPICGSSLCQIEEYAMGQFLKLFNYEVVFVDGEFKDDCIKSVIDCDFIKVVTKYNKNVVNYENLHILRTTNLGEIKSLLAKSNNTMLLVR